MKTDFEVLHMDAKVECLHYLQVTTIGIANAAVPQTSDSESAFNFIDEQPQLERDVQGCSGTQSEEEMRV